MSSRYSPQDKARAVAALRVSAEVVDGELAPRFREVARADGMPSFQTLRRWWTERDVSEDVSARVTLQRAKEVAKVEGAATWLEHQQRGCKEVAEYILHEMHRTGGPEQRIPPHQMARALKDLWPILNDLHNALNGTDTGGHAKRLHRLRMSAKRVGLTRNAKAKASK